MDGRVQLPVIRYLRERFGVEHVDSVTEAGPNQVLAERTDEDAVDSILRRVSISVDRHGSVGIALVGHHDCAGNPATAQEQRQHLASSIEFLRGRYPDLPIIGLWVDHDWQVREVIPAEETLRA